MAAIGGGGVDSSVEVVLTDKNLTLWSLAFVLQCKFSVRFAIRMNMFTLLSAIRSLGMHRVAETMWLPYPTNLPVNKSHGLYDTRNVHFRIEHLFEKPRKMLENILNGKHEISKTHLFTQIAVAEDDRQKCNNAST